jgi:superfamily II DNA or RNA helicase
VNNPQRNQLVVDAYRTAASGRKAVAFCCDIAHAQSLTKAFKRSGIQAECLTSKLTARQREKILNDHKNGRVDVLVRLARSAGCPLPAALLLE